MIDRKIPPEKRVKELVKEVMRSRLKVESQDELAQLVLRELRKENKKFTLSPMRVKRIALQIPEIEVKAKTKKVVGMQKIDKCPICEAGIKEIRVKNLLNRAVVIGYRCTSCGYESDLEAFMPMEYIFLIKRA